MWENGAPFESVLNAYTSAAFPAGIDPSKPGGILAFSSNASSSLLNGHLNGTWTLNGSSIDNSLPIDTS